MDCAGSWSGIGLEHAVAVMVLLVAGGVIGFSVSLLASGGRRDVFVNIVLGMLAALTTSHVFAPLLGRPSLFTGDVPAISFLVSMVGALVILSAYNLFRLNSPG